MYKEQRFLFSRRVFFLLILFVLTISSSVGAHGSTSETAYLFSLSTTVTGTLHGENTQDWWQVEVPEYGVLDIDLFIPDAEGRVRMWFYHVDRPTASLSNIYLGAGEKGGIQYPVSPGVYLVRLDRNQGSFSYQLTPELIPSLLPSDPGVNHSYETAGEVPLEEGVTGTLGHYISGIGLEGEDWWQVEVPEYGVLDIDLFIPDEEGRVRMWFYHVDRPTASLSNIYLGAREEGGIQYPVSPGIYLVRLERNQGFFSYGLTPELTPSLLPSDPGVNHSYETAGEVPLGEGVTGTLGHYISGIGLEGEDWWQVEVPEYGVLDLNVLIPDEEGRVRMWFYHVDRPTSSLTNIYLGAGEEGGIQYPVSPGIYLVRLERNQGSFSYGLTPELIPSLLPSDPGVNHSYETAGEVPLGEGVTGTLGHYIAGIGFEREDWWQVGVPAYGVLHLDVLIPDEEGRVRMWFYHVDRPTASLTNIYLGAREEGGIQYPVSPGVYLVRLEQNQGHFSYGLQTHLTASLLPPEPQNPQQRDAAVRLQPHLFATGNLGYYLQESSDWWEIQVPQKGELTLHLFIPDEGGRARMFVYQGDSSGSTANTYINAGTVESISLSVEAGNYPVQVERNQGHFSYLFTSTLTVEGEEDFQMTGFYPGDGATWVPHTSALAFHFNQWVEVPPAWEDELQVLHHEKGSIPGEIFISQNFMVFQPWEDLAPHSPYSITLHQSLTDTRGQQLKKGYSYQFSTGETLIPEEGVVSLPAGISQEKLLSALERLEIFIHEARESQAIHSLLLLELESIQEAFTEALSQE